LPFLFFVQLSALWALAQAAELLTPGPAKLDVANVEFLGICFVPVAALAMALDYAGHRRLLTIPNIAAACIVPVATTVIIWTDPLHRLFRSSVWLIDRGSYEILGKTWGTWFWIHSAYSYLLLAAAMSVLVSVAVSAPPVYRRQPVAMVVGSLVPIGCHAIHALFPSLMRTYDFTPVGLIVAGVVFGWALVGIRLFNIVPIARHALVESLSDGVLVLDRLDKVVDLNESARTLIGRPASQILTKPLADSWPAWAEMAIPHSAGASHAEIDLGANGSRKHFEVRWSPLQRGRQLMGRLVVLRDITERVRMEENLRRQALTDGLTGLPNRALFMARLDDAIHQARRHEEQVFAVMVLDLDRFKLINDSIGHLAGDVLLQSVAAKLKRCVREADTVARMGGDEFMVLLHHVSSDQDLLPVIERIQEELRHPVYFRQQEIAAGSSVGVVIWNPTYEDAEDMLRAADTAMYQAKEAGRGCHRIFDEEMHRSVLRTVKAETDLRVGIRQRDFSMSYQPIADLRTGAVRSIEALLRWRHPERGTVFPQEFITVAENGGLMIELGEMALDEVCSQISRWQSSRGPVSDLPVSLNISPRQLTESDFVSKVVCQLSRWHVPSDRLTFEITENALIRDPLRSKQVMGELRGMGIGLCLDDFGSGASSLQHLTTFPVGELKIDPLFISRISAGSTDLEVVRSLTALAHTLGLTVIGEGVEHSEQWRLLEELGCDAAQGYYVGRPMDVQELVEYLDNMDIGSCLLRKKPSPEPNTDAMLVPPSLPGATLRFPRASLADSPS
jgi:diguanylate cyclase (GGDEF)-like protein/PAS domain S-box-containing protein